MNNTTCHAEKSRLLSRRWLIAGGIAFLALVGIVIAVCSNSKGSLTGRVTFHGKPIRVGTVVLLTADGNLISAAIDDNATYRFDKVPAGKARLGVISRDPAKAGLRQNKLAKASNRLTDDDRTIFTAGDPKKWFPIDTAYEDPRGSRLEAEIAGPTEHEIQIQ